MREGSPHAPTRHPLAWQEPAFYDPAAIDAEMRRVFEICHGCRRCFDLCDAFPRLFDLIDASRTGELDAVASEGFRPVVDACTLCDMCFMTRCPYVPPHAFDLDFPHLMLRYRAMEARRRKVPRTDRELARTDRNGRLAARFTTFANWVSDRANARMRRELERRAGIAPEAELPRYTDAPLTARAAAGGPEPNREAPAFGRKAVLYATCYLNYNEPGVGEATRAVLARNGVETEVVYPRCCGMPMLEQGRIAAVAANAGAVAAELAAWIAKGYDIVALVPSCALMLKFEWPLILPGEAAIALLAAATFDLSEYVVDIARKEGLAPGLGPIPGGIAVHVACHARAQNIGQKAVEMLRLLPEADLQVIERCSGHGGLRGFKKPHFDTALRMGRPVARQAREGGKACLTSECPLAGVHIRQGMEKLGMEKLGMEKLGMGMLGGEGGLPRLVTHPIELMAQAYESGAARTAE